MSGLIGDKGGKVYTACSVRMQLAKAAAPAKKGSRDFNWQGINYSLWGVQ